MREDFLYTEKYRPRTVADTLLPAELKATFQQFVDQKNVPNLLLCGSAGVGKTTIARAILEQIGSDYIVINGSLNAGIDVLREDISRFASSVSMLSEGRKYVILDEADYLNHVFQPALRNFMEEFANNCGFILTANYKNKIIGPLHSRCSVIEMRIPEAQKDDIAAQLYKRVIGILKSENVAFDKATVAALVKKYFPDARRILNELQRYGACGKIDSGILVNMVDESIEKLMSNIAKGKYQEIRRWVGENSDLDQAEIYRKIHENMDTYIDDVDSKGELSLILGKYGYQAGICVDAEINTIACLTEIMTTCQFKGA